MNIHSWSAIFCSLTLCCLLNGCYSGKSQSTSSNSVKYVPQRVRQSSKDLRNVFENLDVKPIFDSPYRNSSKTTSSSSVLHRQRFSKVDAKLALVGLVTLGGIAILTPFLPAKVKQRVSESLESRQSFQGIVTNMLVGISESLMTWIENSLDDVPSLPRLDAQECMKRSVCEAHNQPQKYGLLGLVLQLFFPPYTETEEPSKIVSKYQLAARYGRQENANCGAQYDGCMMNFLELFRAFAHLLSP